mgnify:CR=1 FL=1
MVQHWAEIEFVQLVPGFLKIKTKTNFNGKIGGPGNFSITAPVFKIDPQQFKYIADTKMVFPINILRSSINDIGSVDIFVVL